MSDLRLSAEDAADLEVISAFLQDAVTRVGDLAYLPGARRFAMVVNRFRWEGETSTSKQASAQRTHERVRTGLHFENVLKAQARGLKRDNPQGVLNLLAIRFEELDTPSGIVVLTFSGGGELRLEVEALDAHLSDLGLVWPTSNLPAHDLS